MLTVDNLLDDLCDEFGIEDAPLAATPEAVEWIENNFYLYDTGKLMTLYDCQRRPLELALSRDVNGSYKYNTILWSWPKKSAKSSVIAAVADYTAEHRPNGSVKLVANDLKQADSRVGYYLREAIMIGQRHGQRQHIKVNPSGYKISYPNGAKIECVPIDPSGEAGGNDDLIVFSELWGWKSKAQQRMWSEMTLSPNKWGNSQRWIDTYAGIIGESPILEQLYETGVTNGRKVWDDLEVYVNDAAKMLAVWVTKPMFSWQTPEYYAQEAGQLLPSEYSRMHENKWAESTESFIPVESWDACKVPSMVELGRRGVIMGIDAAVENDCFAVVIVSKDHNKIQLRYCHIWSPQKGQQINFEEIEIELKRLFSMYNITEVAYDPYQMASMAQRLGQLVHWKAFNQGAPRLVSDKRLYDMILNKQIEHIGDYPELRQHMINADRKPEDTKLRIVKRVQAGKIDGVVALSMAVDRAVYYNL